MKWYRKSLCFAKNLLIVHYIMGAKIVEWDVVPCQTPRPEKPIKSRFFLHEKLCSRKPHEVVCHTPKRGVGGSNPLMDASEQRRKPLFSRVFGFSYMKRYEKALSLYEIKFYSKIWFLTTLPANQPQNRAKNPANQKRRMFWVPRSYSR